MIDLEKSLRKVDEYSTSIRTYIENERKRLIPEGSRASLEMILYYEDNTYIREHCCTIRQGLINDQELLAQRLAIEHQQVRALRRVLLAKRQQAALRRTHAPETNEYNIIMTVIDKIRTATSRSPFEAVRTGLRDATQPELVHTTQQVPDPTPRSPPQYRTNITTPTTRPEPTITRTNETSTFPTLKRTQRQTETPTNTERPHETETDKENPTIKRPRLDKPITTPTTYRAVQGANDPLSNFAPSAITINGRHYTCAEQAYQTEKARFFNRPDIANHILYATDPAQMKAATRHLTDNRQTTASTDHERIKKWNGKKVATLFEIMQTKFNRPDHRRILLDTTNDVLFHPVRDSFWGTGSTETQGQLRGNGADHFANLLTILRARLTNSEVPNKARTTEILLTDQQTMKPRPNSWTTNQQSRKTLLATPPLLHNTTTSHLHARRQPLLQTPPTTTHTTSDRTIWQNYPKYTSTPAIYTGTSPTSEKTTQPTNENTHANPQQNHSPHTENTQYTNTPPKEGQTYMTNSTQNTDETTHTTTQQNNTPTPEDSPTTHLQLSTQTHRANILPKINTPKKGSKQDTPIILAQHTSTKTIIIGDSQLRNTTTPTYNPNTEILSVPGAQFRHISDILHNAQPASHIETVIIAVGINNRNQNPHRTAMKPFTEMIHRAGRVFPLAKLYFAEIEYHPGVPVGGYVNRYSSQDPRNHIPDINEAIRTWIMRAPRQHLHYIPGPATPPTYKQDNLHFTDQSANRMVAHWIQYTNNQ